jgi:hypothetical protein
MWLLADDIPRILDLGERARGHVAALDRDDECVRAFPSNPPGD